MDPRQLLKTTNLAARQVPGVSPPVPDRAANKLSASPFTPLLPGYRIIPAYFGAIQVPAGLTAGYDAYWYGLRRFTPFKDSDQEITCVGANIELLPCNVDGVDWLGLTSAATIPWGDVQGVTAAIVIGRNLPIQEGEWRAARAASPLLNTDPLAGPGDLSNEHTSPEYFCVQGFPTGKLAIGGTYNEGATAVNKINVGRQFSPYVNRITQGNTLDVALVMRSIFIEDQPDPGWISGFANVRLLVGNTIVGGDAFTEV